jgi:hypothetical protein
MTKRIGSSAVLIVAMVGLGLAQTETQPKSLAEIAREAKQQKKEQAKIVLNEDSPGTAKPLIPDVFPGGLDNTDDILKAIEDYRASHNGKETEEVIHIWFDKHDAMLVNAIDENKRIEERDRDRQMGYLPSDVQYRSPEEYQEARRVEIISRREDYKRKQENGLLSARIQQTFTKVRSALVAKGMKYEWFKIRCGNGNCSY